MKISDKLDSIEAVKSAMGDSRFSRLQQEMHYSTKVTPAWWAIREQWRLNEGHHEITEALEKVNNHAKVFAHVSKTDKTKVAFTPDKAFGERDAQLQMNFGKLVQRVIPFASDEYVKTLTESHVADLSNDVEWVEGKQIEEVYSTTSVGSCMAKPVNHWKSYGLPEGVTPAVAYAAPGIKMAVLRDAAGEINARCMVYESGNDKRLIRAYGDGALKKRLMRLGYQPGGWQGVKFNTIKWRSDSDMNGYFRVAIPYLDSRDGPCSSTDCTVMLLDGELTGVMSENLAGLESAGVSMNVPGTAGYVMLKNTSAAEFLVDDILTGEKLNTLTTKTTKVALLGGRSGVTVSLDQDTLDTEYASCRVFVRGRFQAGYKAKTEHTFIHAWDRYLESDEVRMALGFCKLSPTYYTEGLDVWHENLRPVIEDGVTHNIREADVVNYYEDGRRQIHKSKLPKKAIRVANFNGDVWFAAPDTEILRTPTKAKVVRGLHEIREGWKGIDYHRNLNYSMEVFGTTIRYKNSDKNTPEFNEYVTKTAKQNLEKAYAHTERTLQDFFSRLVPVRRYIYPSGSNRFFRDGAVYNSNVSHLEIPAFKEFLKDYKESCTDKASKALACFCETRIAEMEAVNGEEPVLTIEAPEVIVRELEAA